MTENEKELPKEEIHLPEPQISEPEISKEEINKKIDFNWKQISINEKWDDYIESWKQYDFYKDLKQKLYK